MCPELWHHNEFFRLRYESSQFLVAVQLEITGGRLAYEALRHLDLFFQILQHFRVHF